MLVRASARSARTAIVVREGARHSVRAMSTDVKVALERNDGRFRVKTFNAISPVGLEKFPGDAYDVGGEEPNPHAILLRSHKLQESDVDITVRAIARCGAGTNNCNVDRMTELGIPVFNTPGANANAVKELVIAGLFLASRDIVGGANHMTKLHQDGIARERVEKDKSMFGGGEVAGKTLGVIGLGHIGAAVAQVRTTARVVVGPPPTLSPSCRGGGRFASEHNAHAESREGSRVAWRENDWTQPGFVAGWDVMMMECGRRRWWRARSGDVTRQPSID